MPTVTGRATDFITFSRPGATGGGATVTDSDGKIKWAGHNLLTNSESFDASFWTKGNIVTTGSWVNSIAAPNGTTTADLIRPSTSSTIHYVNSSGAVNSGTTVTFSIFVRAGGYTKFALRESGTTGAYASFDITAVSVLDSASAGGVTVSNPQIVSVGSSWFLASITFAIPAGVSDNMGFWVLPDSYTTGQPSSTNWSGDGTKGLYLWGAHLYRSDLGAMVLNPARGDAYYPTTPRNLLGFTEDFSNAAWAKSNVTVASNAVVAPNGLQTADTVTATSNNGEIYQGISFVVGTSRTSSIWIRRRSGTGTISLYAATAPTDITSLVTNEWTRISITSSAGTSLIYSGIKFGTAGDAVDLWGAQLSDSASLDAYSPVYGAAVTSAAYYAPRLDYDANGSALGLLVEEQRTNLIPYSNQFEDASWGLAGGVTVVNNPSTITSPDGTSNADRVVPSTSPSAFNYIRRINITTANVAHTLSVYARASGYNFIELILGSDASYTKFATAYFNVSTGEFVTSRNTTYTVADKTITPVGGGWFRCTLTVVLDATATTTATFTVGSTTNPTATFTGDGTSGVLFYGAQLEVGASSTAAPFPTSYIPTIGNNTATRTADVASVSTQAFPYSASEGTVVFNGTLRSTAQSVKSAWGLYRDNNERIFVVADNGGSALRHFGFVGGNPVAIMDTTTVQNIKDAMAYKADNYAASLNGGAVLTDTSAAVPLAATTLEIGFATGNLPLNGWVRQITYIPRRLSNAELQSRSA